MPPITATAQAVRGALLPATSGELAPIVLQAVQNDPGVLQAEAAKLGVTLPTHVKTAADLDEHLQSLGPQTGVVGRMWRQAKTAVTTTVPSLWHDMYDYRFSPLLALGIGGMRALQLFTRKCDVTAIRYQSGYCTVPDSDLAHFPAVNDLSVGLAYSLALLLPTLEAMEYATARFFYCGPDFASWWEKHTDTPLSNRVTPHLINAGSVVGVLAKGALVAGCHYAMANGVEPLALAATMFSLGLLAHHKAISEPIGKAIAAYRTEAATQAQIPAMTDLKSRLDAITVTTLPADNAELQKEVLVTFIRERLETATNLCAAALANAQRKRDLAARQKEDLDPTRLTADELATFQAGFDEEFSFQDRLAQSLQEKLAHFMLLRVQAFEALLELTNTMPAAAVEMTGLDVSTAYRLKVAADLKRVQLERKDDHERHAAIARILEQTRQIIGTLVNEAALVQQTMQELGG